MGDYTQFFIAVNLKKDTPSEILSNLDQIVIDSDYDGKEYPLVNLSGRFSIIGKCSSAYHPDILVSVLKKESYTNYYTLLIHSQIKNYDSDYEKFINWLRPYFEARDGELIAFTQVEFGGINYYFNEK